MLAAIGTPEQSSTSLAAVQLHRPAAAALHRSSCGCGKLAVCSADMGNLATLRYHSGSARHLLSFIGSCMLWLAVHAAALACCTCACIVNVAAAAAVRDGLCSCE